MPPLRPGTNFPSTSRFEPVRLLGHGAFGVVYEAIDREWQSHIAIKVLRNGRRTALLHFKREFRALADVRHPNLVTLHQLFVEGGTTYFTMELLRGRPWNEAFRSPSPAPPTITPSTLWEPTQEPLDDQPQLSAPAARRYQPLKPEGVVRLARGLRQLAEGLQHLHSVGLIHRDIKPSNVILTEDERVVIVDFGLVGDAKGSVAADPNTGFVPGTPGYIAPEQLQHNQVSPASDWWAVGAMMAKLLLGHVDLDHSPLPSDPLTCKLLDLSRLLLVPDPQQRAGYVEVRGFLDALLESSPRLTEASWQPSRTSVSVSLIGREAERARVLRAHSELLEGKSGWVRIHGPAGFGKSALLRDLIDSIRSSSSQTWLLATTCRDRELVPFRAVDALMDQLSVKLSDNAELRAALAEIKDFSAVGEMFESLRFEPSDTLSEHLKRRDAFAYRRRAFEAWRNTIAEIARKQRIVMIIDDAHWGDADSALLLAGLIEQPAPVLVVIAQRTDEHESPFLSTLENALRAHAGAWTDVEVGVMESDQARALAQQLAAPWAGQIDSTQLEMLVRRSAGVPLMLVTLLSLAPTTDSMQQSFEELVAQRLAALPATAHRLLETVAVSPAPIREDVLLSAVGQDMDVRESLLALDIERLLIARPSAAGRVFEPFHDRLRQAVLHTLSAEQKRRRNLALAQAVEKAYGRTQRPDLLFIHYAGAGEDKLAAEYGELAGEKAASQMAFDRARSIFAEAALLAHDAQLKQRLTIRHADALVAIGRTAAGARVYETAMTLEHDRSARHVLQRRAAEAYLVSGHHADGLRIWRELAPELGLRFPTNVFAAVRDALFGLLSARYQGLAPWLTGVSREPAVAAQRSDAALAAAKGLIATDPMRGTVFGLQGLCNARNSGDAEQLVISQTFVAAACLAAAGGGFRRWAMELLEQAEALTRSHQDDGYLRGVVLVSRAQIALFQGRWSEATHAAAAALGCLAAGGHARTWEANLAQQARLRSLEELGQLDVMVSEANLWLERAKRDEDVFAAVTAHMTLGVGAIVLAAADEAEAHALRAEELWQSSDYSVQRFYATRIRILAALQRADCARAKALLANEAPKVLRSMIVRIPTGRIDWLWMQCRVLLTELALGAPADPSHTRILRRNAKRLAGEDHAPANAHAAFVRAVLAQRTAGERQAKEQFHAAAELYDRCGMTAHRELVHACSSVAAARDRHLRRLRELGIVDPQAWALAHGVRLDVHRDYRNKENVSAELK